MDFFEAQDRARRATWKLVTLYLIAVVLIITSIYLITVVLLDYTGQVPAGASLPEQLWHPGLLLSVSTIILIVILTGSLFRIAQLRSGGAAVAEMLGGRKVEPSTHDPDEQRLIHVVEEMSIASGLPVPDIYLLDREEGINAFAAGFGTGDAAVGVTRGALHQLSRDELQGVIAHEFSHIFNGDMRLNIRLIGILNGILLLHIMGLILMRSAAYSGAVRGGGGSRGQGGGGQATIVIVLIGLALVIIGYIGMIFGRMIQAAVSRQREYLADAAAVQYTRNPQGLAGALRKIADKSEGGKINDAHAMEMSHLFFASSFHSALDHLLASHPPIEKRILAIDPSHDTEHEAMKQRLNRKLEKSRISTAEAAPGRTSAAGGHAALTPEVILAAIGTINAGQIEHAGRLLQEIPDRLRRAAHEPFEAEAIIYALLLSANGDDEASLPGWFEETAGEEMNRHVRQLHQELHRSKRKWYLPLAELALPTLRKMSRDQYGTFRDTVERLVMEDEQVSLFEFALEKMIVRQLDTSFSKEKVPKVRHHHLNSLEKELSVLLSALAHASGDESEKAWQAGLAPLQQHISDDVQLLPSEQCGVEQLDKALNEMARAANPVKRYLLAAALHTVLSDRNFSVDELEMLRAVSEALDCPMPIEYLTDKGDDPA